MNNFYRLLFLITFLFFAHYNILTAHQSPGNLPVVCRKNVGQWDDQIVCKTIASGASVSFLKNGVSFGFRKSFEKDELAPDAPGSINHQPEAEKYAMLVWNVLFKNANANAVVRTAQEQGSRTNYLIGNDRSRWVK